MVMGFRRYCNCALASMRPDAVKEYLRHGFSGLPIKGLKLSYHNGYIYIYTYIYRVNNRVSPIW